jgi:hypothetical protein
VPAGEHGGRFVRLMVEVSITAELPSCRMTHTEGCKKSVSHLASTHDRVIKT